MGSSADEPTTYVCHHTNFFVSLILVFEQIMFFALSQKSARCTLEVGHRNQQAKGDGLLERRKNKANLFWLQCKHLGD